MSIGKLTKYQYIQLLKPYYLVKAPEGYSYFSVDPVSIYGQYEEIPAGIYRCYMRRDTTYYYISVIADLAGYVYAGKSGVFAISRKILFGEFRSGGFVLADSNASMFKLIKVLGYTFKKNLYRGL